MTDKELLELAAKAAGIVGLTWRNGSQCFYFDDLETGREIWDPLRRDGQSLRLAMKLRLGISITPYRIADVVTFKGPLVGIREEYDGDDPSNAVRRAIVRAAAEIGKAMP